MRIVTILLTIVMFSGCASTPPYNPFKVEPEKLIQEIRTIGLVPMALQVELDNEDQMKAEFESYITEKLKNGGYQVIPSKRFSEIYESMKTTIGPMYDPNTGKIIKEKHDALLKHAKREYRTKHDPEALLFCSIIVAKAYWSGNKARWHGVNEPTTGESGFWAEISTAQSYGTIPGLSLLVVLKDWKENEYYVNAGGIQLLKWLKGSSFVDVPQNQLLVDSDRNRRSVDIALAPLLGEKLPKK